MTIILLILALAVALSCIFFTSMPLWIGILMFPLSFVVLLLPLIFAMLWSAVANDQSKPLERRSRISGYCIDHIADLLCTLGMFRTSVTGLEKIPEEERFLLVANHRSAADPMITAHYLKRYNLGFISKPSNMSLPILGNMAYGAGFLSIDRDDDRKALKTIITASNYLKNDVCSICIYPEGTRSRDGKLLPFHAGSFKIAQKAKAPVVIACSYGTEKVGQNLKRLRPSKLRLDILDCIDAERVQQMSSLELAEYAQKLIGEHIERLNAAGGNET